MRPKGPKDPDVPITDVRWQWARSMDMHDLGGHRESHAVGFEKPHHWMTDLGYYLRATAMYTDSFGSGKTASVVSENAVEERTVANERPDFSDLDTDKDTAGTQVARDG